MKTNFKASLKLVLAHEGGWADHPKDPGGATMKGVTLLVFRRYYGADKTKTDLRNITDTQLQRIYRTGYWDKCRCDDLPKGLDYAVLDAAVNSGPGKAVRWLQRAVGAAQDGSVGEATLERVAAREPRAIIETLQELRLGFLRGLSTWPTFGKGWARRVEEVRRDALAMTLAPTEPVTPVTDYEVVRLGSQGPWVERLQAYLGVAVTGTLDATTEGALKAWQARNGLEPDGVAGRLTYRAMGLIP